MPLVLSKNAASFNVSISSCLMPGLVESNSIHGMAWHGIYADDTHLVVVTRRHMRCRYLYLYLNRCGPESVGQTTVER